jgi:Ca-activated chloride channel family protein
VNVTSVAQLMADARAVLARTLDEWQNLRVTDLLYTHREVRLMLLVAVALLLTLLIARCAFAARPGRRQVVLPALPRSIAHARLSWLAHLPVLLYVAGLLSFALALADPHTTFITREETFPGRRIAVVVDASSSMRRGFIDANMRAQPVFYTTVEAAQRFVERRIEGKYRDLMALIEFGNEAYVITPFTHDYDNILLSISLIGDPAEFTAFPDAGNTVIAAAVQQSVGLFRAFDFLDAAGILLVIFTDGEDTHAVVNGVTLDTIMREAVQARIPVYFVRANWGREAGQLISDKLWIDAVARTGGRFYAASDEASLRRAVADIDRVGTGTVSVRQYVDQQSRFAMFAQAAVALWVLAAALQLSVPWFQRFP